MANVIPSKPQLVDHLGRPINFAVLKEERAGPTVAGVRSIISGHPASGLTPNRLAGMLRAAEAGDATSYLELAEEMEEKDLHYLGVLQTRKRQVAQLDITIESASDDAEDVANADLCRSWLDRDNLQDDLFDVLDAVGKGFSLVEIVWSFSERQWWPDRLEFVLPQWTQFDRVDGKTLRLRDGSGDGVDLDPAKYVQHQIRAKSGLVIRGGLARPVSWAWMFKNYTGKDWAAFCEVYGLPLRVGKYEPGATEADKSTLLRAVTEISSDAAAIVPKSMDIEFVDGKHGSADGALFKNRSDWLDSQVSRAVLGQDGTTAMQSGGGYAQSKTLDGVREDIEQADARSLAATLRRDLFRFLVDFNRGPPKSGKYPKVAVGRAEAFDPAVMMPAVERFVRLGGRVERSVIADRLGLPDAPKDAEILTPPSAAAAVDPDADPAANPKPGAPPKKTPPEPANDPEAQPGVGRARAAASRLLRASHEALVAAGAITVPTDAIDDATGAAMADWEALAGPLVRPIEELLAACSSLDEVRDRLAEALADMDDAPLTTLLAQAGFSARLAGLAGADLT